jgi:phosphatidylglycerophosphatase C
MNIAFFDFDGTITSRDSFPDFIIYATGYMNFLVGLMILSPILLGYKLKLISNWQTKEIVLSHFFKDWDLAAFTDRSSRYARERLPRIIRETSLKQISWHKSRGDQVVVVTAAIDLWLKGWCDAHGLDLIATQLEVRNGKLTGRLATKNCYGPEKVRRIKEKYNLEEFSQIYAYGNGPGDEEMLALADCAYLVAGKRIKQV